MPFGKDIGAVSRFFLHYLKFKVFPSPKLVATQSQEVRSSLLFKSQLRVRDRFLPFSGLFVRNLTQPIQPGFELISPFFHFPCHPHIHSNILNYFKSLKIEQLIRNFCIAIYRCRPATSLLQSDRLQQNMMIRYGTDFNMANFNLQKTQCKS